MKIYHILSFLLLFSCGTILANNGEILGKVTLAEDGSPAIGVTVQVSNGSFNYGGFTDAKGKYSIKPLPPGTYSVTFTYPGFTRVVISDVHVQGDRAVLLDQAMTIFTGTEFVIKEYRDKLIDPLNPTVSPPINRDELKKMPVSTVNEAIANMPGVRLNGDGQIQIRAARAGSTLYMVDGVKVRSLRGIPINVIQSTRVLSSFVPAKYGDTTGGVVLVETRSFGSSW